MDEEFKTATAKSPTRKGASPKEKKAAKTVTLTIGCTVTYTPDGGKPVEAVVTGVDNRRNMLYLDSPVVKWVPMKSCRA